jgi:hypothetical protein
MFPYGSDGLVRRARGKKADMKLYVCYGTWTAGKSIHPHPCGEAHKVLRESGHDPEVVRAYGFGALPGAVNDLTPRREVKRLTGQYWVPALITDDGEAIHGSERIIEWARVHPAAASDSLTPAPQA